MTGRVGFNHLGPTVADLARARRFYEGALGFRFWWDLHCPDELASRVLQVPPPVGLTATYLWRPDLVLNLMHFGAPGAARAWRERRLNEPGYTHIALSVDDLPAALARVAEHGGKVLSESMGPESAWGQAVFVRDPDGQLVELVSWEWREKLPPPPG